MQKKGGNYVRRLQLATDDQCVYRTFAVIDIIGSIPIIINLKEKGKDVNAMKATVISFALLIGFSMREI